MSNWSKAIDNLSMEVRQEILSRTTKEPVDEKVYIPVEILDIDRFNAQLSNEAPRVPWEVFLSKIFRWEAGEHVALIGPTGQGKTTLAAQLLPLHKYVTIFATKPKDKTMSALSKIKGYDIYDRWRSIDADQSPRRIIWPDAKRLDSDKQQKLIFHDAFAKIYREQGWTLYLDELHYISNELGLSKEVRTYEMQARALEISLVVATQRPANVPLEIYDQSTHLFFWLDNDERNLSRLSGISWKSANLVRRVIANLEMHQVLYINTRTGKMFRTRAPKVSYV